MNIKIVYENRQFASIASINDLTATSTNQIGQLGGNVYAAE
jgi:hypothetical protein